MQEERQFAFSLEMSKHKCCPKSCSVSEWWCTKCTHLSQGCLQWGWW